ncbi:MAG TPA: MlaD family protein [Hyphomonadaceae bacterium]|jgi:phospholipid/cholesterol/gamma-HCH transport system substrate-binding protein
METRANYVLIGAFVLIGAAALMLFTLWIAGTPLNRSYSTYDVVFEGPVNGLIEGGEVRFNGIKVGEVQRLSLDRNDPNRVIARIRIDAETPVRTDSVAELNFLGITGVTFIQIRAGSPDQPLMTPEDFQPPPVIKTERTALDELFQGGQDLLTVTGETINRVNDALSEENIAHVTAILANLETASEKIAANGGLIDSAQSALKSLDKAAAAIETAATSVNTTVDAVDDDLKQLISDANSIVAALEPAAADVRTTIENINGAVTQLNRDLTPSAGRALEQISSAAVDIRAMMVRIQSLLNEIEQDPSRFVYRQPLPTE